MKIFIITLCVVALSSCSSVHHKRGDILARGDSIAVLDVKMRQALASDVDVLAPQGYSKAVILMNRAMQEAQKSKNPNAGTQTAMDGIAAIDDAERSSERNRPIMMDVLSRRTEALAARADRLFPNAFAKLERDLDTVGKTLESGRQQEAIGKSAVLATAYANLAVDAAKENVGVVAVNAYDAAVKSHALRLAPVTMAKAKAEIDIAKTIVALEKGDDKEALVHAKRGRYFAEQAENIADTLTAFKRERFTDEEKVLWYQDQLSYIHKAHEPNGVSFNRPNREVTGKLHHKVSTLVADADYFKDSANRSKADKTRALEEQDKPNALFQKISDMFDDEEAVVLKREDDIIIRSYGFNFPVGQSVLLPRNYPLLKKIVKAIALMPDAKFEVEGHTDSTGSAPLNLRLSKARAKNIGDYLVKVANIDEDRVSTVGFGYQRPLVHEGTLKERSVNRRIEVVIKN